LFAVKIFIPINQFPSPDRSGTPYARALCVFFGQKSDQRKLLRKNKGINKRSVGREQLLISRKRK
jgi:hypothetical protein